MKQNARYDVILRNTTRNYDVMQDITTYYQVLRDNTNYYEIVQGTATYYEGLPVEAGKRNQLIFGRLGAGEGR